VNTVAVVVPIYKNQLSSYDEISLKRCFETLGSYPIIAIKPLGLDLTFLANQFDFHQVISFEDDFFANIEGYNRLMTSEILYKTFLDYKYILIHQLDAFIFKNTLGIWCSENYDYIGAPWLWDIEYKSRFKEIRFNLKRRFWILFNKRYKHNGHPINEQFRDKVGNGGLSLRKVERFYKLTQTHHKLIDYYNRNSQHHSYNEDVFWGIEINRKTKKLHIPTYRMAVNFSMENGLERAFKLTGGELPFGCHDWDDNIDFWRPYFKTFGYDI
jgi:hypothetical protein